MGCRHRGFDGCGRSRRRAFGCHGRSHSGKTRADCRAVTGHSAAQGGVALVAVTSRRGSIFGLSSPKNRDELCVLTEHTTEPSQQIVGLEPVELEEDAEQGTA